MVLRLQRLVMTKNDVPNCVLESTEILQEITDKSILKWAVLKTYQIFVLSLHGKFVSV